MPETPEFMANPRLGASRPARGPRVIDIGTPSMTDYPPGATHGPRTLNDFEFVWLVNGSAVLSTSTDSVALDVGVLYLLGPGRRHLLSWERDRPTRHGYVHFGLRADDPPARPERPERPGRPKPPVPAEWFRARPFTVEDPLAAMCRYLVWLSRTQADGWRNRVEVVLGCLLDTFLNGPLPASLPPPSPIVDAAVAHVAASWAGGRMHRLPLIELAAAAGVSAGHLDRQFRVAFGHSPIAALELVRLARAAALLARSAITLAAIAEVTGFADESHLSRRFSQTFAMAPGRYRRTSSSADVPLPQAVLEVLPLVDRLASLDGPALKTEG